MSACHRFHYQLTRASGCRIRRLNRQAPLSQILAAEIHLGLCSLDSALVHCPQYHYPTTFWGVVVAICFLFASSYFPREERDRSSALSRSSTHYLRRGE